MPLSNLPEIVVSRCSKHGDQRNPALGPPRKSDPNLETWKKELCELRSALCQVSRGTKIKSWRTQRATAKFQPDQDSRLWKKCTWDILRCLIVLMRFSFTTCLLDANPDKMSGWWGVVSALLDTKLPHRPVRKWPPGCSALLNRIDPMQDDASSAVGCWSSSVAKNENFGFRSDLQMCGAPNQTSSKGYLHKHVSRKKTSSNQHNGLEHL